jgi:CBS domain-containing protein
MRTVRQLLEGKKPGVVTIDAAEPVRTAIQLMADHFIGALPVLEAGRLAGIVSERDYARKVVLMSRSSKETRLREIMTPSVIYVHPAQSSEECMAVMTENRVRHLPVLDDHGRLVGLISIGDLVKGIISEQKFIIEQLQHYITGEHA